MSESESSDSFGNMPRRLRTRSTSVSAVDWLRRPTGSRSSHRTFLENGKNDGFLALSRAIRNKNPSQETQECMLTKFYLFMRDCLPSGLTGEYAHITGDDVMEHLLCCNETAPSRHRLTKQADVAFTNLENWMAKGENWREAQNAHSNAESENKQKRSAGRKKHAAKAPGLHSPAGMLALLIISHPDDTKFKNTIVQKLQIEWMLEDPKILDVRQGFWKGVNASNLYSVFTREEEREAEFDLLANYSRLFGTSFERAQKDIMPYLPKWARGLVRLRSPSAQSGANEPDTVRSHHKKSNDSDVDREAPADDPVFPSEEVTRLRGHLSPEEPELTAGGEQDTQTLAQWLSDQLSLSEGEDHMLQRWCKQWARQLDKAQSYHEQAIVQSLFLRSVRRLYSLTEDGGVPSVPAVAATQHPENPNFRAPINELYIIVDGEDQDMRSAMSDDLEQQASAFFQALPVYRALQEANRRLGLLVQAAPTRSQTAVDRMEGLWKAQRSMLYHITTSPQFSDYFYGVLAFETVRTLALVQGVETSDNQDKHDDWYGKRELLLRLDVAVALQLTGWQLRSLLLPGSHWKKVLTSWQCIVFESKFCGAGGTGLEEYEPMPITDKNFPLNEKICDTTMDTLRKLFGKIQKPQALPSTPKPQTPEPTAPSAPDTAIVTSTTPPAPLSGAAAIFPSTPSAPIIASAPSARKAPSTWSATTAHTSQPSTRHPSFDTSGPAYFPASPNEGNPPAVGRTSLGSQIHDSRKRAGSPMGPRQPKIPRMGWRGDLDSLREGVRSDLHRGLEDLKVSDEQSHRELGAIKTELGSFKADVGSIKTHLGVLRDDLATCQMKLSSERDERRADGESAKANIQQVREETASNTGRLQNLEAGLHGLQASLDTKFQDMLAAIEEVKSLSAKAPPRPEDEGYLVRVCPAPDGQSQRDYESRLFRACLSYMYILWDPFYDEEGGLGLDPNALDQTLKKFPELDKHVLLNALENFHKQVFNCPLTRVIEVAQWEQEPQNAAESSFLSGGYMS